MQKDAVQSPRRRAGELHSEVRAVLGVESAVLSLLGVLGHAHSKADRAPWVGRVRGRLEDDAGAMPSMAELAGLAGVHPIYLARAFRRCFGCSIGDYVRRLQVGRAMVLLEDYALDLSTVAYDAGFADQSHMTRLVRAQTGLTPGAWRRRTRSIGQVSGVQDPPCSAPYSLCMSQSLGRVALSLILAAVPAGPPAVAFPDPPEVAILLARMRQASGGDRWDAVRELHIVAQVEEGGETETRDRWEDVVAGRYLVSDVTSVGRRAEGFDGISASCDLYGGATGPA